MAAIPAEAAPTLKPLQAALLLPFLLVLGAGFLALSTVLGSQEFYVGFFFVLYWTSFQQSSLEALPNTIYGAFFGLLLAYASYALNARFGVATGGLIFLGAVLIPVLYCLLLQWLTSFINPSAMLMLTVGTITHVQAHGNFPGMFINLAAAVFYFGGLTWVVTRLRAHATARAAAKKKR
jgi:fucose 4-O-acetylase-like acetyltransferase